MGTLQVLNSVEIPFQCLDLTPPPVLHDGGCLVNLGDEDVAGYEGWFLVLGQKGEVGNHVNPMVLKHQMSRLDGKYLRAASPSPPCRRNQEQGFANQELQRAGMQGFVG